jgi:hypothetical protein
MKDDKKGKCGETPKLHHTNFEEILLMKVSELLTVNQSIKGQLNKAEAEIVGKIVDLQAKVDALVAAAADASLPEEVNQSIADLQTSAQSLDDVVPDPAPVV